MNYYNETIVAFRKELFANESQLKSVRQAKKYIDQCTDYSAGLDTIAEAASLSKFHFIRVFKKYYGVSPHQYFLSVKIANAKRMLSEGIPVGHVSYLLGWDSPTSFSAVFRKYTNKSPSEFTKNSNL